MDVLKISAVNFDLTEAIKSSVIDKMNKVLSHDKNIVSLDIFLEEKTSQKTPAYEARANLSLRGKHYHAEDKSEDLYTSINSVGDKLLRDIRREHRKFQHDRRHEQL
jgi:ribosomal subunit interface protein